MSVTAKRAIEALRSGVPNRDAVRELGTSQSAIAAEFRRLLEGVCAEQPVGGMFVSGDFGTGKSHLLEYFQHLALERNIVASKVIISRETPLYDTGKVLRAAIENARLPDRSGAALPEIAQKFFDAGEVPRREFERWVNGDESGLNERFGASVYLYENTHEDLELQDRIVRFWGGDPITIAELRRALREMGEGATWAFSRATDKELAPQRFQFVARLIQAAGYSGWVIFFDEVELIGRYSLLQRARSYAEVARWLAKDAAGTPGIAVVMAKTIDFDSAVIDEKHDREQAPNRLRARAKPGDEELADLAERGIEFLAENRHTLEAPSRDFLQATHDRLRALHGQAYSWNAPELHVALAETSRPVRLYVREWINEWDLRRLHPDDPDYRPDIEVQPIVPTYGEDADLEGDGTPD